MTGQIICSGETLWTNDVGQRELRVALLSLEPGARVWLSLDGEPVQFERLSDDADGLSRRDFSAVGSTAARWTEFCLQRRFFEEVELIERPADAGAAGRGYYQRNDDESRAA